MRTIIEPFRIKVVDAVVEPLPTLRDFTARFREL